jgi:hypothetical protein
MYTIRHRISFVTLQQFVPILSDLLGISSKTFDVKKRQEILDLSVSSQQSSYKSLIPYLNRADPTMPSNSSITSDTGSKASSANTAPSTTTTSGSVQGLDTNSLAMLAALGPKKK